MLSVFADINADTPVETLNTLCFIAQTAEKIERYEDCMKMTTAITAVKPDIPECLKETVFHVFDTLFKKNESNMKLVKNTLNSPGFRGATCDRRLRSLFQKIESEQLQIYRQYVVMLRGDFLHASADPENQFHVHKRVADAFMYISDIKGNENRETDLRESAESYETAMNIAEPYFGRLSSQYLSSVLNYSVFAFKYQGKRDDAAKVLKDAYGYGIMNTEKMLPEDRGRAIALLQLMRMNFSKIIPQETNES